MSLADRVARGLKASLLAQVVYVGTNAALVLVLARELLTPEGYGRLFLALSVLGVVAIVAELGLPKSAARYVTEYAETDPGQVPHVLRQSFAAMIVLAIVVGAGLWLTRHHIADLIGEPTLAVFLLAGVAFIVFRTVFQYLRLVFQGFNRVDYSALLTALSSVGRLVFAVAFVLLGLGALGALLGYVVGFAIAAILGLALLYRRFYRAYDAADEPAEDLARRLLEYSVPLTATRGANVIDKRVDTILVGAILNATAVSYYTVAKQIIDFAVVPASSLGFTLSPAYGEQKAGDRTDRAAALYRSALRHVLLLYVPAGVGLALVAEPLVQYVFGAGYLGAVPVVQAFGLFLMVNAVNRITSDGLDYLGLARTRAIAKGGTALANVVLNIILIPVMGVVGAAIATLITFTTYTGVNVYSIYTELSLDGRAILLDAAGACAIALVMAVAVVAALPLISGLLTLLGVVLFGVAVWGALAVGTGLLDVRRIAGVLV